MGKDRDTEGDRKGKREERGKRKWGRSVVERKRVMIGKREGEGGDEEEWWRGKELW